MDQNQLFGLIQSYLTPDVMRQISTQIGSPNQEQTAVATTGALNTLIGALAKNTQDPNQASSLFSAIERDHDGGNLLDNLLGVLTGKTQANNRQVDGLGILMHLLGGKTTSAVDMLTNLSGMDRNKTARLMIMLAPVVLSALGKMKKQQNLDQGKLTNVIQDTVKQQHQNQQNPSMNLITQFLDRDGDGKVQEEITQIGMNLLKNFFKR